jgi:hypothetical protein
MFWSDFRNIDWDHVANQADSYAQGNSSQVQPEDILFVSTFIQIYILDISTSKIILIEK